MRKYTPENIQSLAPNEVFVFGSNTTGFHGAGAAGLACRGDARNTWRADPWFLNAMKSPVGSKDRIGKWAVYGVGRGFQQGREGASYGVDTIKTPGQKRSTSLDEILLQLEELSVFAQKHPELTFLVTKIGSALAGYSVEEIRSVFVQVSSFPDNVILPFEYEFRK
jgi:hypothetical protein